MTYHGLWSESLKLLAVAWALACAAACSRPAAAPATSISVPASTVPGEPRQEQAPAPREWSAEPPEMREHIALLVKAGFAAPEDIVESAVDIVEEEENQEVMREHAKRLVREALERHRLEQATWPKVTDCDRLDQAFENLEKRDIVSRQNFSDCSSCGVAEIASEMQALRQRGSQVRGYTFYHMQDTESAASGEGLYLNYGAWSGREADALKIAHEIVAALKASGLVVEWNGTYDKRIYVRIDWKKRRP